MRYFTLAVMLLGWLFAVGGSALAQTAGDGASRIDPNAIVAAEGYGLEGGAGAFDTAPVAAGPAGPDAAALPEPAAIVSLASLGLALALGWAYRRLRR
jgi:hypothetical protein